MVGMLKDSEDLRSCRTCNETYEDFQKGGFLYGVRIFIINR